MDQQQQTPTEQTSPTSPDTQGTLQEVDYENLAEGFFSDDSEESPAEIEASTEQPATTEVTPEPPSTASAPEAPATSTAEPQPPAVEVPTTAQTTEATPPAPKVEPEAPLAEPPVSVEQLREKLLPELEKTYELPEEIVAELKGTDALELGETLGKILPKLAARMHLEMQTSILQSVAGHVPQVVSQSLAFNKKAQQLEEDFFGRWPDLKGKDESVIINTIQAYRQVNPKVSEKELIERAGALAMLHLGLNPLAGTPSAPQVGAPPAPPAPKPHMPASPGAVGAPIFTPKSSDNFFTQLAEDYLKEDLG